VLTSLLVHHRLEHLGDSVLTMVVTDLLRDVYPNVRVGPSTVRRSLHRDLSHSASDRLLQKIRALVVGNSTLAVMYVGLPLLRTLISSCCLATTNRSVLYKLPDHLITHPAQAITLRASTNIQGWCDLPCTRHLLSLSSLLSQRIYSR
jgi:ribonuclease III